jgi:uncharacterized protein
MKELIETMARALVDNPEQVRVLEIDCGVTSITELRVAKSDVGKVIGRQGRIALAMRTILNAAASKLHRNALLDILE